MKRIPVKTPKINTVKYYRDTLKLIITYAQLGQEKAIPTKESLEAIVTTAKSTLKKKPLYYTIKD